MATNGNGIWSLITRASIIGFCGLCVSGFFFLANKTESNDALLRVEIDKVDSKRQETRERVAKLEECMLAVKSDIADIKLMTRQIYSTVK